METVHHGFKMQKNPDFSILYIECFTPLGAEINNLKSLEKELSKIFFTE